MMENIAAVNLYWAIRKQQQGLYLTRLCYNTWYTQAVDELSIRYARQLAITSANVATDASATDGDRCAVVVERSIVRERKRAVGGVFRWKLCIVSCKQQVRHL